MHKEEFVFNVSQLKPVSQEIFKKVKDCKIIAFYGTLGAGKTTLVRELLELYGVKEEIVSPTFTYMNIYKNDEGKSFYHFDLYRIAHADDFIFAGFDEYLNLENAICFIEWPEVIEPLLKIKRDDICRISINYHEKENYRILDMSI